MKTKELQTMWWDWLGTSERLLRTLHEQTAALVLRDVARVERLQPDLDSLVEQIRKIDEAAAACARSLAETLGTDSNLRSLVQVLEKPEAQQLQALANRVMVAARTVSEVMEKNRKLVDSELRYVNGSLTMIAKAAVKTEGKYAVVQTSGSVLINAAA
jgi:FlgN protein